MIYFKKLRLKNFLSFGNTLTEIELDKCAQTGISGLNGMGKSSLITAFTFGLFGKSNRKVNLPQLINVINNKDCLVELEFIIGPDIYLLRRGLKPTIFEIYKNNILLKPPANNKDYQNFFEDQILKTDFRTFTNVISIGGKNHISFMNQAKADRRKMIEILLGIDIFSVMNQIAKSQSTEIQSSIQEKKQQITSSEQEIKYIKNSLTQSTQLIHSTQQEHQKKIEGLMDQLKEIEWQEKTINNSINNLLLEYNQDIEGLLIEFNNQKDILEVKKQLLKKQQRQLAENKTFFEKNDNCPSCQQRISEETKFNNIDKLNNQLIQILDRLNYLETESQELLNLLSEIKQSYNNYTTLLKEINIISSKKNQLLTIIQGLTQTFSQNNFEHDILSLERQLQEKLENLITLKSELEVLINESEYLDFCQLLLKDEGIKTLIIKQYLPQINSILNQFLEQLDLFINFHFDENFNEIILSRYRDNFTYDSFSDGQKMKIDIALLFTWREIAKLKNSLNTNILFCDEIADASLDREATELVIQLFNNLPSDIRLFLISHRNDLLEQKMDRILHLELKNNFSSITEL